MKAEKWEDLVRLLVSTMKTHLKETSLFLLNSHYVPSPANYQISPNANNYVLLIFFFKKGQK